MTREEAVQRIERAAERKLIELSLCGLELEELPPEIVKCTQLETLLVGRVDKKVGESIWNKLSEFPDAVFQLTNLKRLDLGENQITSIPDAIGQLSNLNTLCLGKNQITQIPEVLEQLSNLRELDLGNNQITSIPEALGQLSNLETLYLDRNQITSIPEALTQLPKLKIFGLQPL